MTGFAYREKPRPHPPDPARVMLGRAIWRCALAERRVRRGGGPAAREQWQAAAQDVEARAAAVIANELGRTIRELEASDASAAGAKLGAVYAAGQCAARDGPHETRALIRAASADAIAKIAGAAAADRAWRLAKLRLEVDAAAALP